MLPQSTTRNANPTKFTNQDQCSYLKRSDNNKSFENSGAKPGNKPAVTADLASLGVLKRPLKHRIGSHPQRVLQSKMRREGSQSLPQSPHAFRARNRRAAVDNSPVSPGPVQLQPRLDDVDRLQTRGLHNPSQRARQGLHVGRDDGVRGVALGFLH